MVIILQLGFTINDGRVSCRESPGAFDQGIDSRMAAVELWSTFPQVKLEIKYNVLY